MTVHWLDRLHRDPRRPETWLHPPSTLTRIWSSVETSFPQAGYKPALILPFHVDLRTVIQSKTGRPHVFVQGMRDTEQTYPYPQNNDYRNLRKTHRVMNIGTAALPIYV